ncbi:MAG TPA: G1 family glutamic endopeptidase [Mycobacteriales bacterium]|nr:G1 family glutamic endopeptidase [Mycobacteriales bacterium]
MATAGTTSSPVRRRAGVVTAAVALCALTATTAADASVTPKRSPIFAGYAVSNPGKPVRQVTATFVVPTITCVNSFSGVGPSVLVYSNINARTGAHTTSGAGVGVACEDGGAVYESVMLVDNKAFNDFELDAGDTVEVSVRVVPAGTVVSLDDVTSGASKSRTGAGRRGVQTFIGDNSVVVDGQSGSLDPFTASQVSDVRVNSRPIGTQHPFRFQWVRRGTTLVSASPLTGGEDFTLTFRSGG